MMISSLVDTLYFNILKTQKTFVDKHRWRNLNVIQDNGVRVYYGMEKLPSTNESVSGGIIKCQDLATCYPNEPEEPNVLYLVSSALPINVLSLLKLARNKGIKVVLNQNGVAYAAWHGKGWQKVNDHLRSVLFSADFVIYQSEFCKKASDHFLGPVKVPSTLLYNPVNTRDFQAQKWKGPLTLLVAGTHHHSYRVELAIRALGIVRQKGFDAQLKVAGPLKWDRNEQLIKKQVSNWCVHYGVEDQVRLLGPYSQNSVGDLFAQTDILIHTQYNDVCPRLLVEAMACGVPPVYSRSGGSPEIVGDDAGIGIAVPADFEREHYPDPTEIAEAVLQIYGKYDLYSQEARRRAVEHFDTASWVAEHKKIFKLLLR